MRSEVASLKFLAEKTRVPVPKVYDFALEGDKGNDVSFGYVMMEKIAGSSLQYKWDGMSKEHKAKILEQLADIFIEIARHPFDKSGSLLPDTKGNNDSDPVHIGPVAEEHWTDFDKDTGEMLPLGPYHSPEELPTAYLKLILDLIRREELYQREYALDGCLVHRFFLDLVPHLFHPLDTKHDKFFIKHSDDKGEHFFVDEDFNITDIIDWEQAYTAPAAQTFIMPITLLPAGDFFDGVTNAMNGAVTANRNKSIEVRNANPTVPLLRGIGRFDHFGLL